MHLPRPFRGFPWWLPLITAAGAAAITALVIGSADPVWAADSRVWIPDEQLPAEDVQSILDDPQTFETALELSLWEQSAADLAAATTTKLEGALITLRVSAHSASLAEQMAASLAEVVVDESYARNLGPAYPQTLGVAWPGARRVAPSPSDDASLAGLGGLLGGIALAAALGRTRRPPPPSALALLGRRGWRPIAMIAERETPSTDKPPPSAEQLADEIEAAPGRVTAFFPLHDGADAEIPARQAARALAGHGRAVLWLDARPSTPTLLALPRHAPNPLQPIDPDAPLPAWLQGLPTPKKREQLRNLINANKARFDAIILLPGPLTPPTSPASFTPSGPPALLTPPERRSDLPDAHREAATLADHIALTARDDFSPTPNEIARTAAQLPNDTPILGIALTHASPHRAKNFKDAAATAQENTP